MLTAIEYLEIEEQILKRAEALQYELEDLREKMGALYQENVNLKDRIEHLEIALNTKVIPEYDERRGEDGWSKPDLGGC